MSEPATGSALAPRWRLVAAGLIAALVLATGGFLFGRSTAPVPPHPTTTSAAAGFARDMQVHHSQAVAMALTIRDRTDNAEIRQLAYDIATAQSQQAGQMYGFLDAWGLPQASPDPDMTWMLLPTIDGTDSHEHGASIGHEPGGVMPGMASDADLARLASLDGVEAEKLFLTLMIAHHQGGIEMAQALIARSDNAQTVTLAKGIVAAQEKEITYMKQLLAERQ